MKTDVTRRMEYYIARYRPRMFSNIELDIRRPIHHAFEVPVVRGSGTNGIVDCIIVGEYWRDKYTKGECQLKNFPDGEDSGTPPECALKLPEGTEIPDNCMAESCEWLRRVAYGRRAALIVCIELKATEADYHSIHGHNFTGNLNYYMMPSALYDKLKNDIPVGRGVLLYSDACPHISEARHSDYLELKGETSRDILLSVIKANSRLKGRLPYIV